MTAGQVSAALKAYRKALDAADLQLARVRAQLAVTLAEAERSRRDAAVLLAEARYPKALDAEGSPAAHVTAPATCTAHDREDSPFGVEGCACAAMAPAGPA